MKHYFDLKYSVAIRTLGKAHDKYLAELKSIERQTVPPKDIFVYLAEGYEKPKETIGKESIIYCKKGMIAQRSLSFDEIDTEYILFLDDDIELAPESVEWASQNMLVLGIVVIAFMIVHFAQFWAKMQLVEVLHMAGCNVEEACVANAANGMHHINTAFAEVWTLPVYIIGLVALWFHMTHGFWSAFQSIGVSNNKWIPRFKTIGNWWATIVIGLFIIQAVVFTFCPATNI